MSASLRCIEFHNFTPLLSSFCLVREMAADIPDRSANAAHVRRFITDVLVSEYYTDPNFASETARAWRIGRGSELHDAEQKYFEELFGVEIGFCLYRSVLEARDKEWQNSHIGSMINCKSWLITLIY